MSYIDTYATFKLDFKKIGLSTLRVRPSQALSGDTNPCCFVCRGKGSKKNHAVIFFKWIIDN